MFAFGLTAAFGRGAPNLRRIQVVMDAFPTRPDAEPAFAESALGAAGVVRWPVVARDRRAVPVWDEQRSVLFAGDVRLYNRPELIAELGLANAGDLPDLELARLAYLRWDHESPLHLVGDFAFAAWNDRTKTLFATRDPLGVRPLYYRSTERGLVVASHVLQVLSLVEAPSEKVSGEQILDSLVGRVSDPGRTFFDGVRNLLPGHRLIATPDRTDEARYWLPDASVDHGLSYGDHCEALEVVFRRAVRDRLESDRPIVAHSSGGFDSSTILMVADQIYRSETRRPPLVMASALVPGFAADESRYMDAVAAWVTFESVRWNVVNETPRSFPGLLKSGPFLRRGIGGGPRRDLELARERGAGVLISGFLGDNVWYASGVLRDLFRHGQLFPVARHLQRARRRIVGVGLLLDAALAFLPPAKAARISMRKYERRVPSAPPAWLGPTLLNLYPPRGAPAEVLPISWESHVSCAVVSTLIHPQAAALTQAMSEYGLGDAIEVRMPHADTRLIEQLLKVPWYQRVPDGDYRRTGRDALGPLLPSEVRERAGQQPWTTVWEATARRAAAAISPFIREGGWRSGPFVDRGVARGLLGLITQEAEIGFEKLTLLIEIGALEAWLRELSGLPWSAERDIYV